jgi:putative PIN family toxin of toxin-antitoxin system
VRTVVDTNVLISGVPWHGAPHEVIERVRDGTLSLIVSPYLLTEFARVLGRRKFERILRRSGLKLDDLLAELRQLADVVDPPPLSAPVSRDPDDDAVLALAVASQADLIVSGDRDLLALRQFKGVRIVSPAEAIKLGVAAP